MAYRTTFPYEGSAVRNNLNILGRGYLRGSPEDQRYAAQGLWNIGAANVAGRSQADTHKLAWEKFRSDEKYRKDLIMQRMMEAGYGTGRYVDVPKGAETMEVGGETLVGEGPGQWRSMVNDPGREDFLRKYGFTRDKPIRGSGFSSRTGTSRRTRPVRRTNVMSGLGRQPIRRTPRLTAPMGPNRQNVMAQEFNRATSAANQGDRSLLESYETQHRDRVR